jgi:uncharacterized protein (TIGR01569 family)
MSEPIVVRKGVYVGDGDGDGHFEHRYHRHRSFHACANFFFRLLTAGATAAAVIVMLKANQRRDTPYGYFHARWEDYPAYKWFIIANAVVFVYAVLGAIVALLSVFARRGPLSYAATAWMTLVLDFLAASALISAASAALAVDLIARKGQSIWGTWCNYTSRFCDYAQGAIIASFIGFYFLALSTLLAASALRYLAHRRYT